MGANELAAEAVAKLIVNILSTLNPVQSDWTYVSFDTSGGSLELPGGIGIGVSGGVLKIKKTGSGVNAFNCGSLSLGVGTPHPIPLNITFSIPESPGAGIIFKMPRASFGLSANDFRGGYCSVAFSAQCGPGVELNFIFMGSVIMPNPQSPVLSTAKQILADCKALVVNAGVNGSFTPIGAGTSYSVGFSV